MEMQYDYEFDKKGNWIKREVFMKEFSRDKKAHLIFIETREIVYYE
jgi:predicted GIY-YIG superfamily endonuclease